MMTLLGILVTSFLALSTPTGPEVYECDADRLAPVRFMIGDWQVESVEPARTPTRERTGHSTIAPVAGLCALQESLALNPGYEEVRLFAFDESGSNGSWQMVIVDSHHGNLVTMRGHRTEMGLEFISTHQRSDALLVDRVSLMRTDGGWLMRVESAGGYGAPWRLLQEIRYTPD